MKLNIFLIILVVLCLVATGTLYSQNQQTQAQVATYDNQVKGYENEVRGFRNQVTEFSTKSSFDTPEKLEKLKGSVLYLKFQAKPGSGKIGEMRGIGAVVDIDGQKYILSLYHIASNANQVTADFVQKGVQVVLDSGDCKGRTIDSWQIAPQKDLVVIKAPKDLACPAIPIGDSSKLTMGDPVWILGAPWLEGAVYSRPGTVMTTFAPIKLLDFMKKQGEISYGENDMMTLSYPGLGGDSGGPILKLSEGRLEIIGIHNGSRGDPAFFSWGIKINPVIAKVKSLVR